MFKSGNMRRVGVLLVLVIAVSAGSAFALLGLGKYDKVRAESGVVKVPAAALSDGKAHFYKFASDGKEIAFFLVKASDGTIRSAFDACDVCYREKKGYDQQGDSVVCKNCNKRFAITRIGPNTTGGCNPSYLPHAEAGGKVLIRVEDLKGGARFF
jgi:uncharacterized membrane protein